MLKIGEKQYVREMEQAFATQGYEAIFVQQFIGGKLLIYRHKEYAGEVKFPLPLPQKFSSMPATTMLALCIAEVASLKVYPEKEEWKQKFVRPSKRHRVDPDVQHEATGQFWYALCNAFDEESWNKFVFIGMEWVEFSVANR